MKKIKLFAHSHIATSQVRPPASKSESNRALIIDALAGRKSQLSNLSEARDTQTMLRLLASDEQELNVLDAGTTMRFLTAFLSTRQDTRILTGTARMCQRPIGILTDALRELGASIEYLGKPGYPPLRILGMKQQQKSHIQMKGDVSSQYISALLMIAPTLPQGLTLELTGKIGSRPYIEMTRALMQTFGAISRWKDEQCIEVLPQAYQPQTYSVESDWSAASYWFSIVALAEEAQIKLTGLRQDSLQGDIQIHKIMRPLGVTTTFENDGIVLSKTPVQNFQEPLVIDFSDVPDLAQTVAVVCAAKGIPCLMKGLESLKIKETDRTAALQNELAKLDVSFQETANGEWLLKPGSDRWKTSGNLHFATYDDHRMAMAFAPLATITDLTIEDPEVVNKSYPGFWKDLKLCGFNIL